jgi:hypothetical protein
VNRRASAEAMLARYGSDTVCGGKTFRAVIRPSGFRSGGADERRYLYFGPAAHKLAPDGTVSSGGTDYSVLRCETVLAGNEELYVRALLTRTTPQAEGVSLLRNEAVFARAESCAVQAVQDAEAAVSWGESAPEAIAAGAVVWELTLSGVRPEAGEDLFADGAFCVSVPQNGGNELYTGCRWKSISRAAWPGSSGAYTAKLLAAGREAV